MKRLYITLALILMMSHPALAMYTTAYCTKPYDVSSKTTQVFSKITGATFISEKAGEMIIRKQLKKETGQKFKVSLKAYSVADLKKGIFKNLKITGKNLNLNGINITNFEAKTLCDFNYFDFSTSDIYNKSNILMSYSVVLTEKDLKTTVQSQDYDKIIKKIDLSAYGIKLVKLDAVDVAIKNGRSHVMIDVSSSFTKSASLRFEISSAIQVVDGKIKVYDVRLENSNRRLNIAKYIALFDFIDPLKYSLDVFSIPNGKLMVKTIDMLDDKILVEGIIFIPKK